MAAEPVRGEQLSSGPHLLKIRLCGLICADCPEPLAQVKVRLYGLRSDQDATALAAANPKETFTLLGDDRVSEKASSLLAEAETDEQGRVDIQLGGDYQGEAFEVDVALERVPGGREEGAGERQFTVTTLQPAWRRAEDGLVAAWDYCLPRRYWCLVRSLFGAYTICGRVVHCETKQPIGGVTVFAIDRDWLQDDPLGSAMTNGAGEFRIDYPWSAFQPGTLFDVELIGGPDLYFRIETGGGAPLLVESSSRGRDPDRENVGPCFCVELCVEKEPPPPPDPLPVFTRVGGYKYSTQIASTPPGDGLTVTDDRAFYATLRLNGILSKRLNGNPMEYRFEVRDTDALGNPSGSGWTPVDPAQIARTEIGLWERYDPDFPGDPDPVKTKTYTVNGVAGPDELVAPIVGGWIRVPQESNVFGAEGYFSPNGNMIMLVSQTLAAWGSSDLTGLAAGNSATAAPVSQALVQDRHFSLRMRVREVGNLGAGSIAGTCQHIAIDNTLYDNLLHHPSWMAVPQSGALGVAMIDIAQLVANGCAEIGSDLDVLFTAEHPNLGGVTISMSGPGGPYAFTLPAAATPGQDWFGTATPSGFTVADLDPCAYIVGLSVQLLLTTGDSIPDNLYDQIAFCKA